MDMNIKDENAEKQQQLAMLEEDEDGTSVPNWLIDVLKWITRMEMANSSLSFVCKLFNRLCWPKLHGNVKAHSVRFLEYYNGTNKFGNICGLLKSLNQRVIPIASTPSPEYILGFGTITIRFLDTKIIEFVKNIALEEIYLEFYISLQKVERNDEQLTLMGNLLTILANNIYSMQFFNHFDVDHFSNFNRIFPTFIDQVPFLYLHITTALDFDILFDWLMKPLTNGRQKILYYRFDFVPMEQQREMERIFLNCIKEEFLHSSTRKNFMVALGRQEFEKFNLQNEQTGEMLDLYDQMYYSYGNYAHNSLYLVRCPKGEEYWKEKSNEKATTLGKTNIQI